MRHRVFGKKLGRTHNQRQALLKNLTRSIFIHGSIKTTNAKAKAVHSLIEKLSTKIITKDELIAKRELFKILQDQTWVNNVVSEFKKVFGDQSSNFTKIEKLKFRYGDDSLIVRLSFVKPIKFLVKKEVEEKKDKKGKKIKETKKDKKITKKEIKEAKKESKKVKKEKK
jgi:large subunit ribosomal protein L17